jgi:glycosyltransferase involved in cell wall biosynthesis
VIPAQDRTEAEAMVKQRNLGGHIDWESNIPEQRLDELYRRAATLIVPSRCEGFGYPILEGISRGIPSIGYRRTPAIEITGNTLDLPSELNPAAFAASIRKILNLTQDERTALVQRFLNNCVFGTACAVT